MRNGFRSSRGAMRGTMGGAPICLVGAVGFATVAIGVGPFVYSICLRNASFTWPKFGSVAERNGTRFVHVHSTYGIAYQSARTRWDCATGISGLRARSLLIPEDATDDTAQEPQSPGEDEQPEQKSHDASKKDHLNDCELNGRFWLITIDGAVRGV